MGSVIRMIRYRYYLNILHDMAYYYMSLLYVIHDSQTILVSGLEVSCRNLVFWNLKKDLVMSLSKGHVKQIVIDQ